MFCTQLSRFLAFQHSVFCSLSYLVLFCHSLPVQLHFCSCTRLGESPEQMFVLTAVVLCVLVRPVSVHWSDTGVVGVKELFVTFTWVLGAFQ